MVFSLALALVGVAMVGRSLALMRLVRADLARTQAEYALDGAHLAAAAAIVRSTRPGPYRWTLPTEDGWTEITAAAEADKLSLDAASRLEDQAFAALGVTDPEVLRGKLTAASGQPGYPDIRPLEAGRLWRTCAPEFASAYGRQASFTYAAPVEPGLGSKPASWHIGEAWRITITTSAGWRDARIVRFTGDARHPAATVLRWLSRGGGVGGQCETVLKAVSAA